MTSYTQNSFNIRKYDVNVHRIGACGEVCLFIFVPVCGTPLEVSKSTVYGRL